MTNATLSDDDRWQIAMAKDRRFDGVFVTGVHSTGIYCRPSCPARKPLRKNVKFYANAADAETAGLRACKRCAPNAQSAEEACVLAAIAAIRGDGTQTLDQLAELTGYSPTHFQRLFKRTVGLSPAAFARALREEKVLEALDRGAAVTDALHEAGYPSASRFYADMKGRLGMQASDWRDGGKGRTIHWSMVETSLGTMLVAATDIGVCCLSFNEGEEDLRRRFPNADLIEGSEGFSNLFKHVITAVEEPAGDRKSVV